MSPEQSKKAVSMAMPLLMGAMAKNSEQPQEAENINKALDKHDGSILDNLDISSLLSRDDGSKIVNHIL
jgi:hypothetical protein